MHPGERHRQAIEEATARLIGRAAAAARGLTVADVSPRVGRALEKYLFRDNKSASGAEIGEFVETIRADDLCLVIACERGDEKAWEELVKTFDQTVKSAARKMTKNAEDAEDLAGSIWAELYGLRAGKSKLAYYSGRGSLAGWLRAVTSQLAIDQIRKTKRLVQIEEDREFENLAQSSTENPENRRVVSTSESPEEIFGEKEAQKDVARALKAAIDELAAEDRLILKLYYFDDLKLKEIGATLGFHEATASRKLARVQSEIRSAVEKILRTEHGWSEREVKRFLAETAEKLGLNLEQLFAVLLLIALVQDYFSRGVL